MNNFLAFLCGLTAIGIIAIVFSLKTKGFFRLLLNSLIGSITLLFLSVAGVNVVPVNPVSMLIVSLTGVPGLIAVALIVHFV